MASLKSYYIAPGDLPSDRDLVPGWWVPASEALKKLDEMERLLFHAGTVVAALAEDKPPELLLAARNLIHKIARTFPENHRDD